MKNLYAFLSRNRKKIWFSILLNAMFLLFLLLVTRPAFDTNDDITLSSFFNLGKGAQDGWTNISNYLFGAILCLCYRLTAQIPWYILFLYGATFLALTVVTHILLQHFDGWGGLMLSGLLLVFFGYECYVSINFTKNAACAGAAGAFLIYSSARGKKTCRWGILLGSLMVLMGYLIRPEAALAASASTLAGAFYLLLRIPAQEEKGQRGRRVLRYVTAILPAVILVAGAKGIDSYAVRSSDERSKYREYMSVRSQLMDYGFPDYSRNQEAFQNLYINKNAWKLYRTWNFYDPEKFPVAVMDQVVGMQPERKVDLQKWKDFLDQYPDRFFQNQIFLLYLFILALVILYGKWGWEKTFAILFHLLLMVGIFFYLFVEGRYGMRRVDVGIWWGGILGLLVLFDPGKVHMDRRAALSLLAFGLLIQQAYWYPRYRRQTHLERAKEINKQNYVSMLSADQDHLYICMAGCYYPATAYGPFDRVPVGAMSNLITLGGWAAESIPYRAIYQRYGVQNPYRDMIGSKTIRVIAEKPDIILRYLQDYYDPACTAEPVGTIGDFTIYSFHD